MNGHTTENDAPRIEPLPYMDGYDWLLNNCGDLDKAARAAHLDERQREVGCSYCEGDEGWLPRRARVIPLGNGGAS